MLIVSMEKQSFYIELKDGTYELVNRIWKADTKDLTVIN
jgi:hypothetical protein